MKFIFVILLALLIFTSPAIARMPSPVVLPTDQALPDSSLRLAALLRITGLTCHDSAGKPLFPLYQMFTQNNAAALKSYQTDLLAAYRQKGVKDPEKTFHARETEIENIQSLAAAKAGVPEFCGQNVPVLQRAALASPADIKRMVVEMAKPKESTH
jgi:hypothetical protein